MKSFTPVLPDSARYQKIVLAGGSGYLGKVLKDYYSDKAKEIIILSRQPHPDEANTVRYVVWDGKNGGDWIHALEDCDLLVNLSGKSVNCRYTKENREEITRSRVEPTEALGQAIGMLKRPPKLWINLASATIYRHAEDHAQDEESGEIGYGFSVDVCRKWETVFRELTVPGTRKVVLRTGMVLGRSDGVFPRLKNLVRWGMGGCHGHGHQYVSWIHEQDFARITEWLLERRDQEGIFNATAPQAVQNRVFMKLIRKSYGVPIGVPMPQWVLEMGAGIIGTETELLLKSRWVYPKKLLESGFRFQYPEAAPAVHDLIGGRE